MSLLRPKKMCQIFLLLVLNFLDRTCLGYSPVNMATIAGRPVTMSCGLQSDDGFVRWKFQSIGSREAKFLFNGYNLTKDLPKHFINGSKEGQFNLGNKEPGLEDAGTYQCIRAIATEKSYQLETSIAQLTVSSSIPSCGSNASRHGIVEGDHVRMWCSVNYLGNLDPVMEWSRDDGRIIYSYGSYNNASHPFNITTNVFEMMKQSDQDITYICKTYFKTPAVLSDKSDTFYAKNAPDYTAECRVTITVLSSSIDSSPGNLLIVIVGTGAALGGITVAVIGVILLGVVKRKRHSVSTEYECAEERGSTHDYESVNSVDVNSTQHPPDIKMDQLLSPVYQSITETEDLTSAETLTHYSTLDGSQTPTVQEPRFYITLQVPNRESKEAIQKPHDYLMLI